MIQRHGAQKCSEMTGPNKKVVASRAGAKNQNGWVTGEVDELGQWNFATILMQRHTFKHRIKRTTTPNPSHRIKISHLRDLYNKNLDGNFKTFFKTEKIGNWLDGQAMKIPMEKHLVLVQFPIRKSIANNDGLRDGIPLLCTIKVFSRFIGSFARGFFWTCCPSAPRVMARAYAPSWSVSSPSEPSKLHSLSTFSP